MEVPDVSYARSGDVAIAYQVVGDGPTDLVIVPFLSNIWSLWHLRAFGDFAVKDGVVITPPLDAGLVAGITREVLFEIAQEIGVPMREQVISTTPRYRRG